MDILLLIFLFVFYYIFKIKKTEPKERGSGKQISLNETLKKDLKKHFGEITAEWVDQKQVNVDSKKNADIVADHSKIEKEESVHPIDAYFSQMEDSKKPESKSAQKKNIKPTKVTRLNPREIFLYHELMSKPKSLRK